ncbi:sodium hydrogen exchanger family protein [Rutstroemia sp. NJR-2017a BBW]|nr:sodium hydrogen exchanger family protein [Rutstroemia sp. NJR-2017a BBW]
MAYLPYVEPALSIILPLSTLIILLNLTRNILDHALYCGLIGEIIIGILFGLPTSGTFLLSQPIQETVQCLGYLGLVGLVFEGGLTTDLGLLRKTIWTTLAAGAVGILAPMILSLSLLGMRFPIPKGEKGEYPTPLAAFSASVALCSTSLGSTFIILTSANMQKTPVGTLIAGAAMIDDVLVLVMVKIVIALGQEQSDVWTIARPAVSSLGLILVAVLLAPFVIRPLWIALCSVFAIDREGATPLDEEIDTGKGISRHTGFLLSTPMLIALVTVAAYVEGSVLLAAFLAGAVVKYTWQEDEDMLIDYPTRMFEEYYKPIMNYVFIPFFFASIGFSIPISEMFVSSVAWKGLLYSILMFVAKGVVGGVLYFDYFIEKWTFNAKRKLPKPTDHEQQATQHENPRPEDHSLKPRVPKAPHLDAIIVGSTMIARGGFGFLVASEAQSSGALALKPKSFGAHRAPPDGLHTLDVVEDQIFLVIIWALVLCTIAGPIVSGFAVRRKLAGNKCECGMASGDFREDMACHLCL